MELKQIDSIEVKNPRDIIPHEIPIIAQKYNLRIGDQIIGTNLEFKSIRGLYLGENLFICDSNTHKIQVLDNNFNHLLSFGRYGNKNAEFSWPKYIKVNYNDQIIISDYINNKIQIFDQSFNYVDSIKIQDPFGFEFVNDKYYICSGENIRVIQNKKPIETILVNKHIYGITLNYDNFYISTYNNIYCYSNELIKYENEFNGVLHINTYRNKLYVPDHDKNYVKIFQL